MMNSRKSWVNIPLLKNIIKNNLFPAKVSLIIFVGVFILSLISGSNSGFSQICIVVYGISAVVLTTIYPCFIQSYQVNKTKSSMMCSLPLTTRCVWFTNYLAGYLIALVTLLIEGLGLMMFLGLNNAGTEGNIFIRFIMAIFLLLFIYYTLTYLVCSLSGNRLGQVVFSLAAYALPVILLLGLIYISPKLVPSNLDLGINDTYLYLTFPLAAGMQFIYSAYPHIFFHLFLGIVTLICSYYVYKNRENEYIGEPLVFRRIIIVLKAILIIAVTICGFEVILLVSKINITYGFKGQSLLFLIYILTIIKREEVKYSMDKYISNKIKNISLFMTFFVVILHSNNLEKSNVVNLNSVVQNFIGQGIVRVAVPIFFLISGYLFFYNFVPSMEKWKYKFKSRFHSLFIPYVIWCTGWLIILYLVELLPIGRALFSDRIVSDYTLKELFVNTYVYPLPYQFWYIRSLMLDVILTPVFYYIIK